jgi:hypothetical protein
MAARSKHSQSSEKKSTKPTKEPTTPAEAAELLTSALSYCADAGLIVEGYNEDGGLTLHINGFQYAGGKVIVTPIGVTMV